MSLPSDVRRKIASDFEPAAAQQVLARLASEQAAALAIFSDRILRCAVFVAHGDLKTFEQAISLAHKDSRDLIVWAEYDNKFGEAKRDLSKHF